VDKLVGGLKDKWTIEVHSNTRFTKNFKLIKK